MYKDILRVGMASVGGFNLSSEFWYFITTWEKIRRMDDVLLVFSQNNYLLFAIFNESSSSTFYLSRKILSIFYILFRLLGILPFLELVWL